MTDLKYQILEKFYTAENRAIQRTDLLNQFKGRIDLATYAVDELKRNELIKQDTHSNNLVLTSSGAEVFEDVTEERQKSAQAEARHKRDHRLAVAAIIAALIPSAFDLIQLIAEFIRFLCNLR